MDGGGGRGDEGVGREGGRDGGRKEGVLFFFPGILALIIIRTLRRDIARYNKDEEMVSLTPGPPLPLK